MKKLLSLLLLCTISFQAFAIPANPEPFTVIQPNGDTLTVIQKGDEFINWGETEDGYTLLVNSDFHWVYAQRNEAGDLEPSQYLAANFLFRSQEVSDWLQSTGKNLFYSQEQVGHYMEFREMVEAEYAKKTTDSKISGTRRLLVILMEYPDKAFTKTKNDFEMLLNQVNYGVGGHLGSMRDFYLESSYNKFEIICTVVGPYMAKKNSITYVNNGRDLAAEAIQAANAAGVDFKPFAEGNQMPGFYMVYAGRDGSSGCSTCIWAHAFYLSPSLTIQGIQISKYAGSSEIAGSIGSNPSSVAVFCHEYGHTLGAPDYYDTDYEAGGEYLGTGRWDIMAQGTNLSNGRTPPTHNPRSKINTYNWAKAIVLDYPQTVTVPVGRIYENAYFRVNPPAPANPIQYFLIENKEKKGFDAGIPGEGLLIYKLTEPYETSANTTSPQRFYPVAANAPVAVPQAGTDKQSQYGNINNASCPWPGTLNKTTFDNTSTPAMVTWTNQDFLRPITNITKHGDYITFDFMGGGPKQNYHVFLPAEYGYMISAVSGSTSPVSPGGNFSFKIDLLPHYTGSDLVVKANDGDRIIPEGNVYTISNIQEDQIVRITGVQLGIAEREAEDHGDKISIYPNPATGKLMIETQELEITDIDILDMTGRRVSFVPLLTSSANKQIDISHLGTGIYFVKIQTDKGTVTKKVVKE